MKNQSTALLSVLEVERGEILMPGLHPESRLMIPESGLAAFIIDSDGSLAWQSDSSIGLVVPAWLYQTVETETFQRADHPQNSSFLYRRPITWVTEEGSTYRFILNIHENGGQFSSSVSEHRHRIILWLGLVGAALLLALMMILRWSLAPLQKVRHEIDQVERGLQEGITGTYPSEISELSERINLFIRNERDNLVRYKNTLGDLAHSLKTPLAVIRGMAESGEPVSRDDLSSYVNQMGNIVNYQLNRAAASRVSLIYSLIEVAPIVNRLAESLEKVYVERKLDFRIRVDPDLGFYGEESDLIEIIGNLMDNACKWANSTVFCQVTLVEEALADYRSLLIAVEDDGPGIPFQEREEVLQRGFRADQQVEGQGIGLAICRDIANSYRGELKIRDSDHGGAAIIVTLRHPLDT